MAPFASMFAAALLAYLGLVEHTLALPSFNPVFPRQDDGSSSELCIPSCEFGTCGGLGCPVPGLRRRAWDLSLMTNDSWTDGSSISTNPDLVKRVFRLNNGEGRDPRATDGNIKAYMAQQWPDDGAYDGQYRGQRNRHRPRRTPMLFYTGPGAPNGDERAMSQQFSFFDAQDNPEASFEIGQAGMTGCTVLALISNRGVWMAHLWEIYSHGSPSEDFLANQNANSFQAFQERSLRFLTDNTAVANPSPGLFVTRPPKPYIAPDGPSIDANLFNRPTDNTQLVLFVPTAGVTDQQLRSRNFDPALPTNYRTPQRNKAIADTISLHLSNQNDAQGNPIPNDIRVVNVPYAPIDKAALEVDPNRGRGIVYFQYDNDADGNGATGWRLFMEGRQFQGVAQP